MPKKAKSTRRSASKVIGAAARTAKRSAKAVLLTKRTLPKPVEIDPRPLHTPVVSALRREHRRLSDEIKHQDLQTQDHPTSGNHMADDATEVEEQTKSLALRRHLEGMLAEVERALARAEKGAYGICERCHRAIAEERLRVIPAATLCIECAKLQARTPATKAAI